MSIANFKFLNLISVVFATPMCYNLRKLLKERLPMSIILFGGLLIILFAVVIAVVASVVSAVAASQDELD